ncbi:hypothetical protein KOAAANKH_02552 [Brevundimonas sp. NIBR10]|uniref:hypothetical protein n=1 Tax=Brevundimonas sp. NIBR10 TaxID=3015997 RepID=UPI0022F17410|nr:hypothetical protein [Brevundimonas sp. NIBR10]WGM47670.1 hypothetical protein KOAAANKH_02552 [Brevundimonas sp. NIBR10]
MTEPPRCETSGKLIHETPAIAKRVARNMRRFGKAVETYRCPFCNLWHVGRQKHLGRKTKRPRQHEADGADDPWDALSGFRLNR